MSAGLCMVWCWRGAHWLGPVRWGSAWRGNGGARPCSPRPGVGKEGHGVDCLKHLCGMAGSWTGPVRSVAARSDLARCGTAGNGQARQGTVRPVCGPVGPGTARIGVAAAGCGQALSGWVRHGSASHGSARHGFGMDLICHFNVARTGLLSHGADWRVEAMRGTAGLSQVRRGLHRGSARPARLRLGYLWCGLAVFAKARLHCNRKVTL